jgi:hypothetical protein
MATAAVKLVPGYVRLNSRQVAQLFNSPAGPVMRHLSVRATRIQLSARLRAGHRTGMLRASIVKRFVRVGSQAAIMLIAVAPHALIHHEGTRPHVITARNAPFLVFPSKTGGLVFARSVNHPGTKPNRFLTDAARADGLRVRLLRGIAA